MNAETVFLFAKFPAPGRVKTRLIPALGPLGAAQFAQALVLDMASRLARENLGTAVHRVLCFDPPESALPFAELLTREQLQSSFELLPQASGDLGHRLAAALKNFAESPALFLGADAPDLPLDEIQNALSAARNGRAYIQHARDGGYVLLALPAHTLPDVFSNIAWSTPQTGAQQSARIRELNIPLTESPHSWPDVDEPADLPDLLSRLEQHPALAPRTLAQLRSIP